MATHITLSNFLQLIIKGLDSTELSDIADIFERTVDLNEVYQEQYLHEGNLPLSGEVLKLQITDIELDLPVHIHVRSSPSSKSNSPQLALTLPSTLETSSKSRLGRLRFTIGRQQTF